MKRYFVLLEFDIKIKKMTKNNSVTVVRFNKM